MTDCPHEHEPDTGPQTFRDHIREETDGGRSIARFLTNAMFDKDWCALNRLSPESARRFYGSIWDIFRIKMEKSNGRRLFKGIQLVEERTSADADRA